MAILRNSSTFNRSVGFVFTPTEALFDVPRFGIVVRVKDLVVGLRRVDAEFGLMEEAFREVDGKALD